jgi:DNA repair protein RecO (recombination protein O)
MTRVSDEPGLVLHSRAYRETSAIVTLLTPHHGRLAVVARGVRGGKRGNVLQPFNLVRASWSGRSALGTLTACELARHAWLSGNALASGFYVLELLNRLLAEHEGVPDVFAGACWTLQQLETVEQHPLDVTLRRFEKLLLESLGYGVDFQRDADTGAAIDPGARYLLRLDQGFVATRAEAGGYPGERLLEIAADDYRARETRLAARKIFRQILRPMLGPRPLASRRLLTRKPVS